MSLFCKLGKDNKEYEVDFTDLVEDNECILGRGPFILGIRTTIVLFYANVKRSIDLLVDNDSMGEFDILYLSPSSYKQLYDEVVNGRKVNETYSVNICEII